MNPLDELVIAGNLFGATAAVIVNVWAARADDPRRWSLWSAVAVLAGVYVFAYLWLSNGANVIVWSRIFRGVSLVAWPLAWCAPALLVSRQTRQDRRRLEAARSAVVERFDA